MRQTSDDEEKQQMNRDRNSATKNPFFSFLTNILLQRKHTLRTFCECATLPLEIILVTEHTHTVGLPDVLFLVEPI